MSLFGGCGTALVTPFAPGGEVDYRALGALVEWQIAEGIDFLVPCGSTGEAQTLTSQVEELKRMVEDQQARISELQQRLGNR